MFRWYEWDLVINADDRKVGLKSSEKQLPQLEGVGQQLAISFNKEGSILALGDEVGIMHFTDIMDSTVHLVWCGTEWPSQSVPVANGTAEGDVLVLNSVTLRVQTMVRKAHITVVTTMGFSETSRNLMSTSMDSSARVTVITKTKNNGN